MFVFSLLDIFYLFQYTDRIHNIYCNDVCNSTKIVLLILITRVPVTRWVKLIKFKFWIAKFSESIIIVKGLLDYAIKIAAIWVACKKLQARIARPFTLRIQHRAIFKKSFSDWIFNSVSVIVFQFVIVCLKSDTVYQLNFMKSIHNLFSFLNKDLLKRVHISVKVFWTFTSNEEMYGTFYYNFFYTILHPFLLYLPGYFKPFLNLYLHIKFIQNAMQILSIRNTII